MTSRFLQMVGATSKKGKCAGLFFKIRLLENRPAKVFTTLESLDYGTILNAYS